MQHSLAQALSNIVQYFTHNQDQFFGLVIIVSVGVLCLVIRESVKRKDQFDESRIFEANKKHEYFMAWLASLPAKYSKIIVKKLNRA